MWGFFYGGIFNMQDTITKDDLIKLGYPTYTSISIIRQAKANMVQKGYALYNNKRLGRVPRVAVESILGFELKQKVVDHGED